MYIVIKIILLVTGCTKVVVLQSVFNNPSIDGVFVPYADQEKEEQDPVHVTSSADEPSKSWLVYYYYYYLLLYNALVQYHKMKKRIYICSIEGLLATCTSSLGIKRLITIHTYHAFSWKCTPTHRSYINFSMKVIRFPVHLKITRGLTWGTPLANRES